MALSFRYDVPISFFQKGDGDKARRVGGVVSTESKDFEDETVLQRGLDFSHFQKRGWFNDNHSKNTAGIAGYPDRPVQRFRKGQKLPDGVIAKANCTWAEGHLLRNKAGNDLWDTAKSLEGTDRRLGFSVEGKVLQRDGGDGKRVTKALVRNIAITNAAINDDTQMNILAKSLTAIEQGASDADKVALFKALTMGARVDSSKPIGPKTGEGAGQVLATQSLEQDDDPPKVLDQDEKDKSGKTVQKSITDREAVQWFGARLSRATPGQLAKMVALTKQRKRKRS